MIAVAIVVAVAAAIIVTVILHRGSGPAASPSPGNGEATAAYSPTATGQASPSATAAPTATIATQAAPPPLTAPTATMVTGPAAAVLNYFAAISRRDYATAWNLGGRNLDSGGYQHFVDGLSTTISDTATITGADNDQVYLTLDAAQSDGTHLYFSGYYIVAGDQIMSANMH